MIVIDHARFCYWSKQRVLSSNTFGTCKFGIKKNEMKYLINDDFEPSSSDESYNESDNGSDNNKLND